MRELRLLFIIGLILSSSGALAKNFSAEGKNFAMDVPASWREAKNLYGVPLSLLGPVQESHSRPVVLITPTPLEKIRFGKEFLASFDKNYQEGRQQFIKAEEGEIRVFIPSKMESWSGIKEGLSVGYDYQLGTKNFSERSFYLACDSGFYHLKILVNESAHSLLQESLSIVRSFKCLK